MSNFWSINDKLELYRLYVEIGPRWKKIAENLKTTDEAARKAFNRTDFDKLFDEVGLTEAEVVSGVKIKEEEEIEKEAKDLIDAKKRRMHQDHEVRKMNAQLANLAQQETIYEKIVSAIDALPPIKFSEIKPPPEKQKIISPQESVLLIGDVHIGLAVMQEEVGGISSYNTKEFRKRAEILTDHVIHITKLHRTNHDLDTIHVCFLGDLVHGQNDAGQWGFLHQEQNIIDQVFEASREFIKSILKLRQVYSNVKVYGVFGNHGRCLETSTKILTADGYKSYNEIKVGDLVGTFNTESEKFEFQPIQKIHIFENEEKIIRHASSNFDIGFSYDHEILIKRRKTNKFDKIKAIDIINKKDKYRIPTCCFSKKEDYDINDDLLRLIGFIMSDGRYLNKSDTIQIYQAKPKGIKYIEDILKKLQIKHSKTSKKKDVKNILGVKTKSNYKENTYTLFCSDEESGKLVKKIRNILKLKNSIPSWMYDLSDRQVSILLEGIVAGDGNSRKRLLRKKETTIWGSKKFLTQLNGLLMSHGISSSINLNKRKNKKILKNREVQQSYYLTIRTGDFLTFDPKHSYIEEHNDKVWCVTVENGNICVLNDNGKSFITGNCGRKNTEKKYVNWDYLVYKWMEASLQLQEGIEFFIPRSNFHIAQVMNKKILLTHGDQAKSWSGIPWYGLNRMESRYRSLMDKSKSLDKLWQIMREEKIDDLPPDEVAKFIFDYVRSFDFMACGHFHSLGEVETSSGGRIILNSSFFGGDDYSINNLIAASTPAQKFFGINHERKTWSYDIELATE